MLLVKRVRVYQQTLPHTDLQPVSWENYYVHSTFQSTRFLLCRHQLCHASDYFKNLFLTHRKHDDINVSSRFPFPHRFIPLLTYFWKISLLWSEHLSVFTAVCCYLVSVGKHWKPRQNYSLLFLLLNFHSPPPLPRISFPEISLFYRLAWKLCSWSKCKDLPTFHTVKLGENWLPLSFSSSALSEGIYVHLWLRGSDLTTCLEEKIRLPIALRKLGALTHLHQFCFGWFFGP